MSLVNLTPGEQNVLALAWHCFTEMPKVDTAKLAEVGGYRTAASANAVYLAARKKIIAAGAAAASADGPPATPKTPKTPKKRGANDDSGDTPATGSAKKKRRTKAQIAADAATAAADEDDEEATKQEVKTEPTTPASASDETGGDAEDVSKLLEGAKEALVEGDGGVKVKGEDVGEE